MFINLLRSFVPPSFNFLDLLGLFFILLLSLPLSLLFFFVSLLLLFSPASFCRPTSSSVLFALLLGIWAVTLVLLIPFVRGCTTQSPDNFVESNLVLMRQLRTLHFLLP